jgi:hypothetical protein
MRGKADWIVRGLPTEPRAPIVERLSALPYFLNNLAPGFRRAWIRFSGRITVSEFTGDDLTRVSPTSRVAPATGAGEPAAVVLDGDGVLLGAIESATDEAVSERAAWDAMNPAPQTIRPDMTPALAASLLRTHRYILVSDAYGRYIGRYNPPVAGADTLK